MSIEMSVIISLLGVAMSVATFYIGRQTAARNKGEEDGNLKTDLQYIKSGIADIQDELKSQRNTNVEFAVRLAKVEDSLNLVNSRVDKIEHHISERE